MSAALPRLIQNYVDASNAHEVQSILACFADDATVHDENITHRGKIDIERWLRTTIEKYKFQFKPLSAEARDNEGIVANMTASTVAQYVAALPADRRAALSAVRKAINENLPDGYEEGMQFGMIGWYVPLSVYPAGYGENPKVPLSFVALASQKSGMVLHFLCFYGHPTLSTR